MRAHEFITESDNVINIHITIPSGGGTPVVSAKPEETPPSEPMKDPVMVSPLQQELELAKAKQGKESTVLDRIVADDGALSDDDEEDKEPNQVTM